jgi:uncharacterized membrane protein YeaQ/YmgE (transglycosylase-associated protein family)
MDLYHLLIKLVIAIVCAVIANVLVPRRIPGQFTGLVLIGLAGVWFGEWSFALMMRRFGLNYSFLHWQIQGVFIIPAVIGCAIVLYVITAVVRWWRYGS